METLYDVLGARPDDDVESLKNAYHKAAKANHPDRNAGDPDAAVRFRRIAKAYDILRNPKQRATYDRLLECQREPLRLKAGPPQLKARRATFHLAYQFAFNAIAGVIAGIVLAVGGYPLFVLVSGITGDGAGGMAGKPPRMVAVEPAKRTDTVKGEAPGHGPARAPRIPVTQGAAASAVEGKGAWEAARGPAAPDAAGQTTGRSAPPIDPIGPKAAEGGRGRDHGAGPPEQPQSTEPKTTAMSQDEICERDAVQLAHLRISQGRDEVIRFERELGCGKLRPQVIRLRESVDPPTNPAGPKVAAGGPGGDHGAEPPEQPQSTEPKTTATPHDETCKRDTAQLAHLRISQGREEVIRFERELGCEKLRPQVIRLRESVDAQ